MSTTDTTKETRKRKTPLATLITRWLTKSVNLSPAIRLKIIEALVMYATTGVIPKLKPTYQLFLESVIESPARSTDTTTTTTNSFSNNKDNKESVSSCCSTDGEASTANEPSKQFPTPKVIPDRQDVSAYLQSKGIQPSEADAQAQAFIDYNEARGWKIGNNRVKSVSQWKWLAQRWMTSMASHPAPAPVAPSQEEQERRRQQHERAEQVERKRMALNDLWTKVRNNLCALFTPAEYMETYHEIQPRSFTADGVLTIHVPGGAKARALSPDYRPALDDAIRGAFAGVTRIEVV